MDPLKLHTVIWPLVLGPPEGGSELLQPSMYMSNPRSPGTHIVGPSVIDIINSYRDLRTGTQYIGNWASRVRQVHLMDYAKSV